MVSWGGPSASKIAITISSFGIIDVFALRLANFLVFLSLGTLTLVAIRINTWIKDLLAWIISILHNFDGDDWQSCISTGLAFLFDLVYNAIGEFAL